MNNLLTEGSHIIKNILAATIMEKNREKTGTTTSCHSRRKLLVKDICFYYRPKKINKQ